MSAARTQPEPDPEPLRNLLEFLRNTRGFDFGGYKRLSLERRIRKRMSKVGVDDYADYEDYLEVHPDEYTELFDTILINVTSFFRDRAAWDHLAEEAIPALLESVPEGPLRIWSAACASGEEAYTAAMVLAEIMGEEAFRDRVKIYATDVDEDALASARAGGYDEDALKAVPEELRAKYFEPNGSGYTFRPDLRRSVIFGRNDLVQDAPISRVDMLISRNTLMYFTPETQARILTHFNFALRETGLLFLGKSEMLITHSELFSPVNLKWRLFKKVPRPGARERLAFVGNGPLFATAKDTDHHARLREAAVDMAPVAQIVLDGANFLAMANQPARTLFKIGLADIGRPLQDLEVSYRPVELRSALGRAHEEKASIDLGRAEWTANGDIRTLEIVVTPILDQTNTPLGATVTFADVTALATLDAQHARAQKQLEQAYEELQTTVEELETTNEELQSTNEELETTNEELQSTNEELETMNEELQSTNDELESVNEEQRERAGELDRVNLFLEGILGNLGTAVVVVDREQHIQLWNRSATELWGLRSEEVEGEHLLGLDIGLPVERLRTAVRAALAPRDPKASELTLEAVNRRGHAISCRVRTLPLLDRGKVNYGAVILMVPDQDGATS